jgi:hypothetical protein
MDIEKNSLSWSDHGLMMNRIVFDAPMHFEHHNERFVMTHKFKALDYPLPWAWMALIGPRPALFFALMDQRLDEFYCTKSQ